MNTKLLTGAAVLLCVVAPLTVAGRNSSTRVQAFAALPDWTGLWRSDIAKLLDNASGHVDTSNDLDELSHVKLLGHPPYNPEWEQKYQAMLRSPGAAAAVASGKSCSPGGFTME